MATLHLVSHTHWDREWYLPFQVFRLQLVRLLDDLLELLADDPAYRHYMLDGQTIILEDYLLMRPEREEEIRGYIRAGRLLIGPWHILPDEFLVSPEALIRNLLQGKRTARRFGPRMMVGYIPDPFGHIGQIPQILNGFGIRTAALRRGLADEPCELYWKSPDGSSVLLAYLRDGYDNAASLPVANPADLGSFPAAVAQLRDSLSPHSATGQLLLMQGTDHMPPQPHISAALGYAQGRLGGDSLIHSTLPAYLEAVAREIDAQQLDIPTVGGELRNPKSHHLLPGVLSTRMWIKQRNHACEMLLERWAEPFASWAQYLEGTPPGSVAPILRQAWHLLLECHPHDSICGCSIDQVHEEMRPRFDQVEQIGEAITAQALVDIAAVVDTVPPGAADDPSEAILVFNAVAGLRAGLVTTVLEHLPWTGAMEIVDQAGRVLPHRALAEARQELDQLTLDRDGLLALLHNVRDGWISGRAVLEVACRRDGDALHIEVLLGEAGPPNIQALSRASQLVWAEAQDSAVKQFFIQAYSGRVTVEFLADAVPGFGYRTFWARPARPSSPSPSACRGGRENEERRAKAIENESLRLTVDPAHGTLALTDKRTAAFFPGLNRFVDGGDCGDEYNYAPPADDILVQGPGCSPPHIKLHDLGTCQQLEVTLEMSIPARLTQDRRGRSSERVPLRIRTIASLAPGIPRVDIVTEVDNPAHDHRLQVRFPVPCIVDRADFDGHFEVVRRPLDLPTYDDTWVEQPRPEVPQRTFTDVSNGSVGLMVANRGLPEVAVLRRTNGTTEIALTLLRCIGWLSRNDFSSRRGHAGPMVATPGAQMTGWHRFEYALVPHRGNWENAYREAQQFNVPLRAVTSAVHAGSLPAGGTFLQVEPPTFTLSAVKPAEDGDGLIVRGYNLSAEPIHATLTPWRKFSRAARVRLDEQVVNRLAAAADGGVHLEVGGHEIATVKLWDS